MSTFELSIKEIKKETEEAVTITFENPNGNRIPYKPGQFLTLITAPDGQEVRRSYSLSSSPTETDLAITIKAVTNGLVSNYLVYETKVGQKIKMMLPAGHFTTDFIADRRRTIVLLGAGSGITPLLSILKTALQKEPKSKVVLIYGNRNEGSIILKKQIDELLLKYPEKFSCVHVLSNASADWQGLRGRLSPEMINDITSDILKSDKKTAEYFFCGPEEFMKSGIEILSKQGIANDNIHKESFVSHPVAHTSAPSTASSASEKAEVTIKYRRETFNFQVSPSETILQTAIDMGLDLPYSCQSGICTACMGICKEGTVDMEDSSALSDREIKKGCVLTCVSRPSSKKILIEID